MFRYSVSVGQALDLKEGGPVIIEEVVAEWEPVTVVEELV
jgi:hypothetical protein